jgi:hypothetical protein
MMIEGGADQKVPSRNRTHSLEEYRQPDLSSLHVPFWNGAYAFLPQRQQKGPARSTIQRRF